MEIQENAADTEKKSTFALSPDAKPFVPQNFVPYTASIMPAKTVKLSVDAPEFFPRNFGPQNEQTGPSLPDEESTVLPALDVIADIQWAIQVLTVNPANFSEVMGSLTSLPLLVDNLLDDMMLEAFVDEIFTHSVREKNFRYTGARMCGHFTTYVNPEFGVRFQFIIISRCQREYDYLQTVMLFDNLPRIIGFTLFMGELLVNMKDVATGQVINQVPQLIANLIYALISFVADEVAVCIVQIFKLAGPILEANVSCMDDLCGRINQIVNDARTPEHIRKMLTNVMELRSSNWGRDCSENASSEVYANGIATDTDNAQPPYNFVNGGEPFYFDENGLCDEFDGMSNFTDSDEAASPVGMPGEYWAGDETMDPEMAAAFEVFLAESAPAPAGTVVPGSFYCNDVMHYQQP